MVAIIRSTVIGSLLLRDSFIDFFFWPHYASFDDDDDDDDDYYYDDDDEWFWNCLDCGHLKMWGAILVCYSVKYRQGTSL